MLKCVIIEMIESNYFILSSPSSFSVYLSFGIFHFKAVDQLISVDKSNFLKVSCFFFWVDNYDVYINCLIKLRATMKYL